MTAAMAKRMLKKKFMSPFTNAYKNQIKAYNASNSQALFVRAQAEMNQTAYVGIKTLAMHLLVFN